MSRRAAIALAVTSIAACRCSGGAVAPPETPCAKPEEIATLRLNQLQLVGSHNSYRRHTYQPIFDLIQWFGADRARGDQRRSRGTTTTCRCAEQLTDYGMRALELDLFNDPAGGRFYERQGLQLRQRADRRPTSRSCDEPGHEGAARPRLRLRDAPPDVRVRAARDRRRGATRIPRHLPLFIHIESKAVDRRRRAHQPGVHGRGAVRRGGRRRAGHRDPVRVRAARASSRPTRCAARTRRWTRRSPPRAGRWSRRVAAGRCSSWKGRRSSPTWRARPASAGRLIVRAVDARRARTRRSCSATTRSADSQRSPIWSRRGYIVRTMADSSTVEARSGDRTRMNAAFTSGAHIVSTDYYRPDPRGNMPGSGWSNYAVALPGGGPARSNPVSAGAAGPAVANLRIAPRRPPPPTSHRAPVLSASVGVRGRTYTPARCRLVEKLGVSRRGATGLPGVLRGRAARFPAKGRVDPDVDLLAAQRDDVRGVSARAGALVVLRARRPARAPRRPGAPPRAAGDDVLLYLSNLADGALGALAVRRFSRGRPPFQGSRSVAVFLLFAVAAPLVVSFVDAAMVTPPVGDDSGWSGTRGSGPTC